jgi:hypothetical protein
VWSARWPVEVVSGSGGRGGERIPRGWKRRPAGVAEVEAAPGGGEGARRTADGGGGDGGAGARCRRRGRRWRRGR